MAALREIKDRIASVRSTLKVTSAMKLVASSKLRKAQRTIEALRPYQQTLDEIFESLPSGSLASALSLGSSDVASSGASEDRPAPVPAVIAVSSNSSLCGAFNANVTKLAMERARELGPKCVVFPLGRKVSDAMKREGYTSEGDFNDLVGKTSYEKVAAFAMDLYKRFCAGEFSRIVLVYNHFLSTSSQSPVQEQFLPFSSGIPASEPKYSAQMSPNGGDSPTDSSVAEASDFIFEPSAGEIREHLLPLSLSLKLYAAILDSAAAEHAARTIAMQTATDNAEGLLSDLTLEYNKSRQYKITAEILDLLGGTA